ncbi:protein kinase domain-containing protein [Streptomyces microflavus]
MEALRREDPRRFGRFTVLARFHEAASAVQYVARDTATGGVAVITAARPALAAVPAFRRRFQAEARTAERLAGGWVTPLVDSAAASASASASASDDAADKAGAGSAADSPEPLWTATEYVPALPLAEAIGIAGPLPERALRILGAGIAEILSRVHAGGAVLQGLAPGTVLLAEDGPRLTAFGPLGAAAAAEAKPGGQLSVRLGYLTPEQVEGKEVGAPSDLFVLGLLLAYAATGTTPFTEGPAEEAARRIAEADPELEAVPEELRELIAGCLAKDPAERPTAGTVAAELALEGAAGLARGGWLPKRLAAAVADQEARVRALEVPEETDAATPEDGRPAEEPKDARPVDAVAEDAGPEDARPVDAMDAVAVAPPGAPAEAPVTQTPADPRVPAATTGPRSPPRPTAPRHHRIPRHHPATTTETYGTTAPTTTDGYGTGTGDIGEDRGTTRFLNTGPKPPQSDRATTQLALPTSRPVPRRLRGPGAGPPPHLRQPGPYPAALLPGSAGQGAGQSGNPSAAPGSGPIGGPREPTAPRAAAPWWRCHSRPRPPSGRLRHQPPGPDRHRGRGGRRARRRRRGGRRDRWRESVAATDDKPAPKPRRTLPGRPPSRAGPTPTRPPSPPR